MSKRWSRHHVRWIAALLSISTTACESVSKLASPEDAWHLVVQSCQRPSQAGSTTIGTLPVSSDRSCSDLNFRLARALLERDARAAGSARSLHRAGVVALMAGEPRLAIQWLEQAAATRPIDSGILIDQSAAYLVLASRGDALDDAARAAEAARAALELGTSAAASANLQSAERALGLFGERMYREDAIAELPRSFRSRTTQGPSEPDFLGEFVERHLTRAWAEAVMRADHEMVQSAATEAAGVAATIASLNGDTSVTALVTELTVPRLQSAGAKVLARRWLAHLNAQEAFESGDVDVAAKTRGAATAVAIGPSTDARMTLLDAALSRVGGDARRALRLTSSAPRDAFARFPVLDARRRWQRGLLLAEAGRVGEARSEYLRARDVFRRFGEREGEAMVSSLVAEGDADLNDWPRAWVNQARANELLAACRRMRRESIRTSASAIASAMGLHRTAIGVRHPAVLAARREGDTAGLAFLLTDDASDTFKLGRTLDALNLLDQAEAAAASIRDDGVREMHQALQAVSRASVIAQSEPRRAEQLYGEAVSLYRLRGSEFGTPDALLQRGKILRRLGLPNESEQSFLDGLATAQRQERSITSASRRSELQAARWELYRGLAGLLVDAGREWRAHQLIETARRNVVGWTAVTSGEERFARTAWLTFFDLDDRVVAWVITSGGRRSFTIVKRAINLEQTVDAFRDALQRNVSDAPEANQLFDWLVAPAMPSLNDIDTLVICGDGAMLRVPFAALRDTGSHQLLLERYSLVVAPACQARPRRRHDAGQPSNWSLLAAGDAKSVTTTNSSSLLPHSRREAMAVSSFYAKASVLLDREVTRANVLSGLQQVDVFHYAGHAVSHPSRPNYSRLIISASADDVEGVIYADEIAALPSVPRLVLLAACETSAGAQRPGAGLVGMAGAFLTAGTETVVATLWPIADRESADLFVRIHENMSNGLAPREALRRAQRAAAAAGVSTATWAAVVAIGVGD